MVRLLSSAMVSSIQAEGGSARIQHMTVNLWLPLGAGYLRLCRFNREVCHRLELARS